VAISLAAAVPAPARAASLAFGRCGRKQLVSVRSPQFQCASLTVPLDRAAPQLAGVTLAVQRIPATGTRQGTIVFLAGGPGQANITAYEPYLVTLENEIPALRGFELVTFDQRGTGQSGRLSCARHVHGHTVAALFTSCTRKLRPRLSDYTSQDSSEDIESLREALGVGQISLVAVSYGGRVAGLYAHEHPQDVARMVLDSPTTLTGPEAIDTAWLRALPRVLDEGICGEGACAAFTTNLYGDLTSLLARLRRRPMRARYIGPYGHERTTFLDEQALLSLLVTSDVDWRVRRTAPAAIAAAAHGDAGPLARLVEEEPAPSGEVGVDGLLYLATTCSEDSFPWSAESPTSTRHELLERFLKSVPAATTAPFTPETASLLSALRGCSYWPPTTPAPAPPTGTSTVSTLILSGVEDLRTPYEQSLQVASGYSDASVMQIPGTGHSTISTSKCALDAMSSFLVSGRPPAACPPPTEPQALPLPPSSLAEVPAAASSSTSAGRAAEAAALTIDDLLDQPGSSGGGLEAGYWSMSGDRLRLHRTVDVAGVILTGTIALGASTTGRIVVRGRLRGTLELTGTTLSGRLGRARVRARVLLPEP
jgi:pimeloyl-ACP methyl ester carboxylesterase